MGTCTEDFFAVVVQKYPSSEYTFTTCLYYVMIIKLLEFA